MIELLHLQTIKLIKQSTLALVFILQIQLNITHWTDIYSIYASGLDQILISHGEKDDSTLHPVPALSVNAGSRCSSEENIDLEVELVDGCGVITDFSFM